MSLKLSLKCKWGLLGGWGWGRRLEDQSAFVSVFSLERTIRKVAPTQHYTVTNPPLHPHLLTCVPGINHVLTIVGFSFTLRFPLICNRHGCEWVLPVLLLSPDFSELLRYFAFPITGSSSQTPWLTQQTREFSLDHALWRVFLPRTSLLCSNLSPAALVIPDMGVVMVKTRILGRAGCRCHQRTFEKSLTVGD